MKLYRKAAIFVLPALYDPMPHAAMEAMALEVPVVVSSECGTAEIITDGESGYVVPAGNSDRLAERLIALLDNPGRATTMGKAGALIIRSAYTWEHVARDISAILLEVIRESALREREM
jgi:glycosyltransferase involved in cell wall biosynthesis